MLPLICIDVDGTLVGSTHEPTDAVWAAAAAAVDRGQHLALSTARGAFGVTIDYARRLDPDGWHIFHNGASLVHTGSGEVRSTPLPEGVVEVAAEVSERNGWVLEVYSADDYVADTAADPAIEHAAMLGLEHRARPLTDLEGEIVRVQFVVPLEVVKWVQTEMAGLGIDVVSATSPVMPGTAFVSCTTSGVTKGTAIEAIAAELGTTAERAMMVGDGHNDLDAVQTAGYGVAMGNAVAALKDAARYVVADVDDDGLVEALELSATL
ncbi:MAG: Cof-type HAD-IIB family hydrolase [Actinomycetota bacterium]